MEGLETLKSLSLPRFNIHSPFWASKHHEYGLVFKHLVVICQINEVIQSVNLIEIL